MLYLDSVWVLDLDAALKHTSSQVNTCLMLNDVSVCVMSSLTIRRALREPTAGTGKPHDSGHGYSPLSNTANKP